MKPDPTAPPLAADDPRLSEWIDGRLPAAEAAEIARAVAAAPELSRLVADLRGIKKSLASLPASPPPAAFVGAVMAALDAAAVGGAEDADVEAEWRKIERERLEEEIAEAREDAAEPVDEPMRHRWPWLALAGALAAGVLAAFVIDRSDAVRDREVALVAPRQHEQSAANRAATEAPPGGKKPDQEARLSEALVAAQAQGTGGGGAGKEPRVRSVTYRIRTAADRQRLESLLAASGGKTGKEAKKRLLLEGGDGVLRGAATDEAGNRRTVPEAETSRRGSGGPSSERIAVVGPADAMARLAAALEAAPATASGAEAKADMQKSSPSAKPAAPPAADGQTEITLVIVVVDESGTAVQADEARP
jgi:hypothetical protein